MKINVVENPQARRHPLWGKAAFLEDLRRVKTVRGACRIYVDENNSLMALVSQVWKWRKQDRIFDADVAAVIQEAGNEKPGAGRPRKDGGDKSWQERYCDLLIEFDGDEERARVESGCPYTLSYMRAMQDPAESSFDREFTKAAAEAWEKIGSAFQGVFFGMRRQNFDVSSDDEDTLNKQFTRAKILETQARIAEKAIAKISPDRWGQKAQVNFSGRVEHTHQLQDRYRTPQELMAALAEDRKKFIENRVKVLQLESGQRPEQVLTQQPDERESAVIDAEVVEDDGREPLSGNS